MPNHFPAIPEDLAINNVTYTLNFGTSMIQVIPALQFEGVATNMFGALNSLGNQGGVQFTFTTPGNPGTFDQDAVEVGLYQLAGAVFNLMHVLTGQDIPALMQSFCVQREWVWSDSAGNQASYVDQMPVPPQPAS